MRVLVTGGREFRDREWLYAALELLHSMDPITELIEGGANGADCLAANWATGKPGLVHTMVPAEWERYGDRLKMGQKNPAGAIRNVVMAKMRPDVVLACPGGRGTQHMVDTARAHGLRVIFLEKMPVAKGPPPLSRSPSPLPSTEPA